MCMCVYVRACMCVCGYVCVRAYVQVSVCVWCVCVITFITILLRFSPHSICHWRSLHNLTLSYFHYQSFHFRLIRHVQHPLHVLTFHLITSFSSGPDRAHLGQWSYGGGHDLPLVLKDVCGWLSRTNLIRCLLRCYLMLHSTCVCASLALVFVR